MDRTFEGRGGLFARLVSVAVVAAAMLALGRRPAAAESILLNPPSGWNGIAISGSVTAGWQQSGGAAQYGLSSSTFLLAGPTFPPLVPGEILTGTPATATALPTIGAAKDKAEVTLAYSVTVGAAGPGGADKFNFSIQAETSAVSSQFDFGPGVGVANADAFIIADFTLMTFAPIPAATFASMGLPALPTLGVPSPNIETMSTTARVGPYGAWTTTIIMTPGFAGSTLPLALDPAAGDSFLYRMIYTLTTPYGTDPSVSLAFEGSMERSSVPEIGFVAAPLGLLCVAFGLVESRQRRGRMCALQRDAQ